MLESIDLEIHPGTWVGLLGPNGSGKTTLLRTLGGLLPYSGSLSLHSRPLRAWRRRALAREIAFVRQSTTLSFDFTVGEMVLLGRSVHKGLTALYSEEDKVCSRKALAQVDLSGFEDRSLLSLSGGEQQRVLLAQALVQGAGILLLDEPTAHLDVHHQFEFVEHIKSLVERGHTAISAFHDLELAARYADTLIVLSEGRQVEQGPPNTILTDALISSVFRMRTRLRTSEDGALRIHYLASTSRPSAS